jgi:phosphate-selective porin OprO and OprP
MEFFMSYPQLPTSRRAAWIAAAMASALIPNRLLASDSTTVDSLTAKLNELDQKVRILERNRELDQEAATAANAKVGKALSDEKGFGLTSQDDKSFSLKPKGFLQSVGTYYLDDEDNKVYTNNFTARRVQTYFDGVLYKKFAFRVHADFAGANFVLLDSYLDWNFLSELSLRVGKFKVPTNFERLQSSPRAQFIEQGYPSALLPNRDLGIQLSGQISGGLLEYQVGAFNGVQDAGSGVDDASDDKDAWARLIVSPFANSSIYLLQGLGFGASASQGWQENGTLPTYRSPNRAVTLFSYRPAVAAVPATATAAAVPAVAAVLSKGKVKRLNPQASYYNGGLSLAGEWVSTTQGIEKAGFGTKELTHTAWQATAAFVITGEAQTYKGLKVKNAIQDSGLGAIEILGRVGAIEFDKDSFDKNIWADSTASAQSGFNWTVGVNWYLNNAIRLQLNYEQNTFDGGRKGTVPTGVGTATRTVVLDKFDEKVIALSFNVAY